MKHGCTYADDTGQLQSTVGQLRDQFGFILFIIFMEWGLFGREQKILGQKIHLPESIPLKLKVFCFLISNVFRFCPEIMVWVMTLRPSLSGLPLPQSQPLRSCVKGENVTLSCSVSGANPPATITWLRNLSTPEVELQPGKKYQIIQDDAISYLTIVNCSHDSDEGYYICKAVNGLATRDLYVWLSVNSE